MIDILAGFAIFFAVGLTLYWLLSAPKVSTISDLYMQQAERETNAWDIRSLVTILVIVLFVAVFCYPVYAAIDRYITPQVQETRATVEAANE